MACGKLVLLLSTVVSLGGGFIPAWADVQPHIQAAENYMQTAQWDYANFEWRNVLSEEPENVKALAGLGRSLSQAGMHKDAIQHLENARNIKSALPLDMALADAYAAAGRYVAAHQGYQYILQKNPNHIEAYRKLSDIQDQLPARYREPVKAFLDRKAEGARKMASQALEKDDYLRAVKHLELASAYSEDTRVHNNYGLSLLLTGDSLTAAKTFYNLERQKPEEWKVRANAAMSLLGLGNSYRARQELEKAISLCPDEKERARLYNNLGYAYEAGRKPTYARFAYERAIAMNPGLTKAHMNLGYIFQQLMEYENAVKAYKRLLALHPNHAEAWNQLGFTYELMHESRKAAAAYQKAIALNPRLEDAYFNLGTLYKKMDSLEKASEIYRKMVSLEFNDLEKPSATSAKPAGTRQAKLVDYVYLYFEDLSS